MSLAWASVLSPESRSSTPAEDGSAETESHLDYFPRDVFFFFGVTALPFAAACFCFFFAVMPDMKAGSAGSA